MRLLKQRSLNRSAGLWLLTYGATAGAVLCGRMGWLSALLGAALGGLLYSLALRLPRNRPPGAVRALQTLGLVAPLAVFAGAAGSLFPDARDGWYVPVVVLALSWLLARQPGRRVLACCAVAGYFVLAAVGIVAVFALGQVQWRWLAPSLEWEAVVLGAALGAGGMVLDAAADGAKPPMGWRAAAFALPAALSAVVVGCLSRPVSAQEPAPFYTLSKSISMLGVAERFEALIAACLTLGVCCVCAVLLRCVRMQAAPKRGDGAAGLICLLALAGMSLPLRAWMIAGAAVVLWLLVPSIFVKIRGKGVDKRKTI